MIRIELSTRALDQNGRTYRVALVWRYERWILDVGGTGGQWFLADLVARPRERIAIDFGLGWYCENIRDVVREAVERLGGLDR